MNRSRLLLKFLVVFVAFIINCCGRSYEPEVAAIEPT